MVIYVIGESMKHIKYDFQIKFDGDNELDCHLLLKSLTSIQYLSNESQSIEFKKELKIVAIEEGSFIVKAKFGESIQGENPKYASDVLNTINEWIDIKEFTSYNGTTIEYANSADNQITLVNNDGVKKSFDKKAYQAYTNKIADSIADLSLSIKEHDKTFKLIDNANNTLVEINSLKAYKLSIKEEYNYICIQEDTISKQTDKVDLKILKANFIPYRKDLKKNRSAQWNFERLDNDKEIRAKIEDDEFIKKLMNDDITIGVNTILSVRLRTEFNQQTKKSKYFLQEIFAYKNHEIAENPQITMSEV